MSSFLTAALVLIGQCTGSATPAAPALIISGFSAVCVVPAVQLSVEHIAPASAYTATGYVGGIEAYTQALAPVPSAPGTVFFSASGAIEGVADCAAATWVVTVSDGAQTACVAQGPDAATFPACTAW